MGHIDMVRTFATLTGQTIPAGGAPDAVDVLPALLDKNAKGRDALVLQNNGQSPLALRVGGWKLIQKPNGTSELYDLATDPSEKKDLAASEPDRVKAMTAQLAAERAKSG